MTKIPKPRFNLKDRNAKEQTLIFLIFNYRGKRVSHSTKLFILPKEWDFKIQRPIEQEDRPDLWFIRKQLDDIAARCKSIYIESDYGVITVNAFKKKLAQKDDLIVLEQNGKRLNYFQFLDKELKDMEAVKMKRNSLKVYKLHVGVLKKFARSRGRFDYEDIDWELRLELIDWLTKHKFQLAYGNKCLSVMRQFAERARKKQLHSNTKYQGLGWKVPQKKAMGQKVILSTQELQKLADMELFGMEEKVRDLFLIGAGTGQRFSDYSRYTKDHFYSTFDGIPLLSVISQKTETNAKIPLTIFPWLIPTLEKYNYRSPKISLQKFNETIKEICKKAGITAKILKVDQYMGRKARVEKSFIPKYQKVASHTCRRSFATNLYRMGYKLGQIMPMTGHASEMQLREYIGIDGEENAIEIARSMERRRNKE